MSGACLPPPQLALQCVNALGKAQQQGVAVQCAVTAALVAAIDAGRASCLVVIIIVRVAAKRVHFVRVSLVVFIVRCRGSGTGKHR